MGPITIEQLKQLSYAEKIQLVEDLWDAIAAEAASQPVSDEVKAEMQRRLAEHRAHPGTSMPWDAAKAELERRFS
ncbi:MAG: addiction module protein [Thiobacillus sp.]|nr:addiction module protein [Thiobacillus sp.]